MTFPQVPITQLDGIGKRSALTVPELFVPQNISTPSLIYYRCTDGVRDVNDIT